MASISSNVNIKLRTLSGELLQMNVNPDDTVETIVQKLVLSEPQLFKCPSFVRIVRYQAVEIDNGYECYECHEDDWGKWTEDEIASAFYDFVPKSYSIHDNGSVPFIVEVGNETISIYAAEGDDYYQEERYGIVTNVYISPVKGELLYETSYQKVWIGDNELNDCDYTEKNIYPGNSILVQLSDKTYLYIGSEIYKFNVEDGDQIKMYFSPVGNSDVPYPYAIGEKMAYFMLDQQAFPVETIDVNQDGYHQFYNFYKEDELIDFKEVGSVHKRVF